MFPIFLKNSHPKKQEATLNLVTNKIQISTFLKIHLKPKAPVRLICFQECFFKLKKQSSLREPMRVPLVPTSPSLPQYNYFYLFFVLVLLICTISIAFIFTLGTYNEYYCFNYHLTSDCLQNALGNVKVTHVWTSISGSLPPCAPVSVFHVELDNTSTHIQHLLMN